jgi:hypothetical protein
MGSGLGGTSENSVTAKFAEFTYQEDKQCMLVFTKLGADFSKGVQAQQCNREFPRPTPAP